MKNPFPLVKLPQDKFLKSGDLIWLFPPVMHMILVVMRPTAIDFLKDAGLKLDGMPQYNVLWGCVIQFTMVAMFAGFGFNPVGLICHNNMKFINRVAKIMLLVASVYMLGFGLKMAEDKGILERGFVKNKVVSSLGSPPLCGVNIKVDKKKKTCEMKLCGVVEALQGTCKANRNQGCCVSPEIFVMDEARHFFALQLFMRVMGPYLQYLVPFFAALVQAVLRLMPSNVSGVVSNPMPFLFRAVLTGDYAVVPYVVAGTLIGNVSAALASSAIAMIQSRVFPPLAKPAKSAPVPPPKESVEKKEDKKNK